MENTGVSCDVCACVHNVGCNKCNLPEIKVTEKCESCEQSIENPHYCQSYEER